MLFDKLSSHPCANLMNNKITLPLHTKEHNIMTNRRSYLRWSISGYYLEPRLSVSLHLNHSRMEYFAVPGDNLLDLVQFPP